jgi:Mg-chelatase subunit ChlD
MTLYQPIFLMLAIPLAVSFWLWKPISRLLRFLRLSSLVLILLAMCGLALKLPSRTGSIVVIADRSLSMPAAAGASEKEAIDIIQNGMGAKDTLGVVTFGERAAIEQAPQRGEFAGFVNDVGADQSNLAEAIDKALSLIPRDATGRILVLSDGRWTGKDPTGAASRSAMRGVGIDYRSLQRTSANDVAIAQIDAPGVVSPGESFMITAWVSSPVQQDVTFELLRGGQRLASGSKSMPSGLGRLTFRDQAPEPGTNIYSLKVVGAGEDPVPENNTAKILVGVQGPRPMLCVTQSTASGLVRLLKAGGLNVKAQAPESARWSLEELSKYSSVLIENVPAEKIGPNGMENIAAWVKEAGAGLMMTGGKNAYGPGGYFRSQLEPIMPVSMELRQEHRKLALAIVVTLDRSGSMAVPAGGGRSKMDLANIAAVQVLDLLSPVDELGVIAVDSSPHTIVDLAPLNEPSSIRKKILRIDSQGGGIFIYEALAASAQMLVDAKAGTRHIMLFADAADSEEPGNYRELIEKCRQAGITLSVIGLGKETDQDAELLRDIARRGGGRIFFTDNPEELPRLFAQDTFVVARSTFLEEQTQIQLTGGLVSLTGKQFEAPPPIGGYNLCYLRPEASLAAVSVDEYKAPVVATWQAGAGRALCYTGEADGAYAGSMSRWKDVGELFTSMARWTAGDENTLPGNIMATQEVRNGITVVQLHLDPDRDWEPFSDPPVVTTLRGVAGSKPAVERASMRWTTADTLELEVPLRGGETSLSTVEVSGSARLSLTPVSLPYSPEFKPVEADEGLLAMERIAKATGGKERADVAGIWKEIPRQPRMVDLTPWLTCAAILFILVEVLERRTGMVSMRRWTLRTDREASGEPVGVTLKPSRLSDRVTTSPGAKDKSLVPETTSQSPDAAQSSPLPKQNERGIQDALTRARRRARERTERGP